MGARSRGERGCARRSHRPTAMSPRQFRSDGGCGHWSRTTPNRHCDDLMDLYGCGSGARLTQGSDCRCRRPMPSVEIGGHRPNGQEAAVTNNALAGAEVCESVRDLDTVQCRSEGMEPNRASYPQVDKVPISHIMSTTTNNGGCFWRVGPHDVSAGPVAITALNVPAVGSMFAGPSNLQRRSIP